MSPQFKRKSYYENWNDMAAGSSEQWDLTAVKKKNHWYVLYSYIPQKQMTVRKLYKERENNEKNLQDDVVPDQKAVDKRYNCCCMGQ